MYGAKFEDPEIERASQKSSWLENRRLSLWTALFVTSAFVALCEAFISHTYPDDYDFQMESYRLFGIGVAFVVLSFWSLSWKSVYPALHELGYGLISCRNLWFVVKKFYIAQQPAPEDWFAAALTLCMHVVHLALAERSPIGAAMVGSLSWSLLLFMPNTSMVFRARVLAGGMFIGWLAFSVYKSNREIFVEQVSAWQLNDIS